MALRVISAFLLAGIPMVCSADQKSTAGPNPAHIAKIKVSRNGAIVLNDKTVTLDVLKSSLSKLSKSANAAVWYYREDPEREPHPDARLVLQAIIEAKLPVKLSTRPDFSDSAGSKANSR